MFRLPRWRHPQATVFLVDNSLSMQYRDGQETRLQRAKTLTSRLVQSLALNDSAVSATAPDVRRGCQCPGLLES